MILFPAIDLYEGKAVRLYKGQYEDMTVYGARPEAIAVSFVCAGASHIHLVDLEGARSGETPNFDLITAIRKKAGVFTEVGGGIRSMDTIERYLSAGLDRVIIGTRAVEDPAFLEEAAKTYGDRLAVSVDVRNGFIATHGWTRQTGRTAVSFARELELLGIRTMICTDITRDGAMAGSNHAFYAQMVSSFNLNVIASGGVSSMDDLRRLKTLGVHGAIIGKAYYSGAIDLKEAVRFAEGTL